MISTRTKPIVFDRPESCLDTRDDRPYIPPPPHPDVKFRHDTKEGAEKDAATLQKYLDGLAPQKKAKSKAKGAL